MERTNPVSRRWAALLRTLALASAASIPVGAYAQDTEPSESVAPTTDTETEAESASAGPPGAASTAAGAPEPESTAAGAPEAESTVAAAPESEPGLASVPPAPVGATEAAEEEATADEDAERAPGPEVTFRPLAYVETLFTWAFREPSNGIVAYRGFDNRHATFTLSNTAFGGRLAYDQVYAHVVLQWGHTPATYYAGEPTAPTGGAAGPSGPALWQVLQEAYFGWNIPVLDHGIRLEGGLFLSPVGIEGLAVYDCWNWSRSNLFFGLPFYHTGLRATVPLDERWSVVAALYNGWNTLLDNNDEKSVNASITYDSDDFDFTLLYFGGVEAGPDATRRGWRNLFDLTATWEPDPAFAIKGQFDVGFEPDPSTSTYSWVAGALYLRVRPVAWFDIALRGDFFWDGAPFDAAGVRQEPIFWPSEWVSSQTATLTFRPIEHLLFRIEYRHDEAASDIYFGGNVPLDADDVGIANRVRQDTLTFGAAASL